MCLDWFMMANDFRGKEKIAYAPNDYANRATKLVLNVFFFPDRYENTHTVFRIVQIIVETPKKWSNYDKWQRNRIFFFLAMMNYNSQYTHPNIIYGMPDTNTHSTQHIARFLMHLVGSRLHNSEFTPKKTEQRKRILLHRQIVDFHSLISCDILRLNLLLSRHMTRTHAYETIEHSKQNNNKMINKLFDS